MPFSGFPVKQDREKTNRIEKKGQQDNKKPYRTAIKPTGIYKKGTGCRQTLQSSYFRASGGKALSSNQKSSESSVGRG